MIESTRIYYREDRYGGYTLSRELVIQTPLRPATRLAIPSVTLEMDGWMTLEPGFRWDGATGACDTPNFMRGSAAHDGVCDLHQAGLPMPENWNTKALSLLNRICREDGMSAWRRWRVRVAVRAGCHARPRDLNRFLIEHVAPL